MKRLSRLSTTARSHWLADTDLQRPNLEHVGTTAGCLSVLSLAWASIGVIYGDIGTSPLYVYSTIFGHEPDQEDVLCATSLVFWAITLVVLIKYVFIVLLADDNGEGGTFALYATICRSCGIPAINSGSMPADKQLFENESMTASSMATPNTSARHIKLPGPHPAADAPGAMSHSQHDTPTGQISRVDCPTQQPLNPVGAYLRQQLAHNVMAQRLLLGITLLMTAMVLGDGVLTPSISVLSAVDGLQVKAGLSNAAVIGITCAILVALFAIQSWGTQRVGILFAPTVALWFLSNVMVGVYNICMYEGGTIFRAMSPHYIGVWFQRHGTEGWMNLSGVFLCLTGCEAMFADLGHFSRTSIQLSFALMVYPSLILTYFGQASWLMHNLSGYSTVFYSSLPSPVFWPVFVVSVLASIVASQALITGAFSMVSQSMAMGCFPRFRIHHTSASVGGQIFISEVNYSLLLLCIAVVAGFQSGTAIGNAYGIAVNMVMLSTVFLVSLVMLVSWGTHPLLVLLFFAPFTFIEGVFLSANILNIPHGGWFSISLALVLSAVNVLWIWGTAEKAKAIKKEQFSLSDVLTTKPPSSWQQPGLSMSSQGWRLFRISNMAPVHRNPGMALVYSDSPFQVPAVFKRLVESWGVHSIVVFLTIRQVTIPKVSERERLLLAPMEFRGFYKCVARYGYMDKVDQGEGFAQAVLDKIAEVVPGHALADGVMPHRSSGTGADPPHHVSPAALQEALATRALACLAPTIAEEPSSLTTSPEGNTNSHSSGAAKGDSGARTATAEVLVQCHAAPESAEAGSHSSNPPSRSSFEKSPSPTEAAAAASPVHRRTWESIRHREGGPPAVSDLAAHAVYVLHRSIIHVAPSGGKLSSKVRTLLLEHVYQQLWRMTTRFWEGWKVPAARLFEVGMMMEI